MRVFLIWADKAEELKYLVSELKKKSHEVVYWVGLTDENEDKISGAVFHDHFAAWAGNPAEGENIYEFAPPGKELIERLYKTESLVLTMMNKKFDLMCADERRNLYYKMLRYWYGVIKKYKPDMIIFPTVPHTVYNYIIYALANLLNIKTIMFEDTWVSDRLIMYKDWMEGSEKLKNNIKKNEGKNFSLDSLEKDLRDYYKSQTDKGKDATPVYMSHWKKQNSILNLFKQKLKIAAKSVKDGTIFKKTGSYIIKQFRRNLKKEYAKFEAAPDFNKKYIYVPLSFQPERTTSPQGDMFVDQILMIEILASSLPDGWEVYVKEHPSQWWLRSKTNYSSSRYPGYYEKIANIKNVKLMPINFDTYKLINNSKAVAVATGTAGWEAILRSKPVLIFAYPWYRDCPCAFRVFDNKSCRQALEKIREGFSVSQQEVINFLYNFDKATMHGYIESFVDKISKVNKKDNINNITQVILAEIEK